MSNIDQAKRALVSAIYFDDGGVYLPHTYEALQHLEPDLYELCVNMVNDEIEKVYTTDALFADDNTLAVHELLSSIYFGDEDDIYASIYKLLPDLYELCVESEQSLNENYYRNLL